MVEVGCSTQENRRKIAGRSRPAQLAMPSTALSSSSIGRWSTARPFGALRSGSATKGSAPGALGHRRGPPPGLGGRVEVLAQLADGDALLLHRVAVAHGDGAGAHRLAVDRDAEGRAGLVLAAVAA